MFKEKNGGGLKPIRVLLIEGDPSDARFLTALFAKEQSRDFDLLTATCLEEARRILESEPVAVALVNLYLRDSSGLNTLAKVYDASPDTAVVVMTDLNYSDMAMGAFKQLAPNYLIKGNIDGPILFRVVRDALERQKLDQERGLQERRLVDLKVPQTIGRVANDVAQNSAAAIACWHGFQKRAENSILNLADVLRNVLQVC